MVETQAERDVIAHGFVRGRVQGVWFRESTRKRAVELGLSGFVRNIPDGRVEAQFIGPLDAVMSALSFVEQGPPHARVDEVQGFEIETLDEAQTREAAEFLILSV
jgi:acylphosphatase